MLKRRRATPNWAYTSRSAEQSTKKVTEGKIKYNDYRGRGKCYGAEDGETLRVTVSW